jgi:hypothetical protein
MPRPRTPRVKAETTGQTLNHPSRFVNRVGPTVDAPLGDPPEWMTEAQVTAWDQFKHELGWLNASHAAIVEIASIVRARVRCGEEVRVSSMNLLYYANVSANLALLHRMLRKSRCAMKKK